MSEVIHTQKKNSKELEIRHFMYSVTQSANCGRVKICKDNTLKHHSQAHTLVEQAARHGPHHVGLDQRRTRTSHLYELAGGGVHPHVWHMEPQDELGQYT